MRRQGVTEFALLNKTASARPCDSGRAGVWQPLPACAGSSAPSGLWLAAQGPQGAETRCTGHSAPAWHATGSSARYGPWIDTSGREAHSVSPSARKTSYSSS